ncbi:hypothetical protein [Sphingobacterium sp. CZ-2]|uniref:hypothetical protein n=1 Tax=Sphingobacterium sp. CZ-2 TaxID=2557994 RepID=UPI00106F5836|nr:hypothetical protein [Sphingobacterium sp. CZ-2]QBR12469.1 hypothetical protein E3D81_09975 [Sphingobacterium sp. CZ-2]
MFNTKLKNIWDTNIVKEYERLEGRKEGSNEGLKEGRKEGSKETKTTIAKKLKKLEVTPEVISEATGLTLKEIEELK